MAAQIFSFIANAFSWAGAYFVVIVEQTGMRGIYLSAIFLMLLFKFILAPVFGSSGSDKVNKRYKDGDLDG